MLGTQKDEHLQKQILVKTLKYSSRRHPFKGWLGSLGITP